MANAFSKEERVAFEDLLAGFQDALVLSKNVNIYRTDGTMMERARDTIWRPMPYIAQSINSTPGSAISGYQDMTQLAVPATLGFSKTVPWTMNTLQLRDALQEGRLGESAKQKLASDINVALLNVASQQGTLVVDIAAPSGTFDDVAACDAIMNEQGVPMEDRCLALSSRDYNGLAGNLAGGTTATLYNGRSFSGDKSNRAYERAFVGTVANFDTFKMDYALRCTANAATITIATNGAQVQYVPQATSNLVGGQINVDNRYQTVTVSSTTGVLAGDMFTVAGIEAVHHITKESTGQPKTFRVISIDSGTTMILKIVPPSKKEIPQEHRSGQHLCYRCDHVPEHHCNLDQPVLAQVGSGTAARPLRCPERCRRCDHARQHRPGHRAGHAEVLRHRLHDDQVSSGYAVRRGLHEP